MTKEKWTTEERTDLVLSVLSAERTVEQAALEHGIDPEEVETWRDLYLAALRHAAASDNGAKKARKRSGGRFPLRPVIAAVAVSVIVLSSITVLSQAEDCTADNTLLCVFGANTPAKASEVNSNFAKLGSWLVSKVGDVDQEWVSTSSLHVEAGGVTIAGGGIRGGFAGDEYDVWIQGRAGSTDPEDGRNLALLGYRDVDNDPAAGDRLVINYDNEYENGTVIDSNLSVSGNIAATGDLTFNDERCRWTCDGCYACNLGQECSCRADEFLRGIDVSSAYVDLYCCRFR